MRQRFIGGALLAAAAVLVGAGKGRTQTPAGYGPMSAVDRIPFTARGQAPGESGFDPPLNSDPVIPIPTGRAGAAGFYTSVEALTLTQNRTIGSQTVAYRGLIDSTGVITQVPGTYLGSGQKALVTNELGRTTFQPGFRLELGYRFDDGTQIYANYAYMFKAQYSAGASLVPPYFRSDAGLNDTYLVSGVYNFPSKYSGPSPKTAYDLASGQGGQLGNNVLGAGGASNTYGIWNGASEMTIKYVQRFDQADVGTRVPVYQTDYSRVYALGGLRYTRFSDGFTWRTADADVNGNALPQDAATYTNILRQNMYGPFVGAAHEVFLANQFSLNLDLTGGLLLDFIQERAKYKLEDGSTQNKRSVNEYSIVPNANLAMNLMWYPIEGVQVRAGYLAQTYFNTRGMLDPIGFNFGAIDPVYNTQWFRIIHGVNVGVSFFF